jgi:hypothetical protein
MARHSTHNRGNRSATDRSAPKSSASDALEGDTLSFDNELDGESKPYYVDLAGDFSIGHADADAKIFPDSEPMSAVRVGRLGTAQRRRYDMPAESKAQQKAAGAALAAKRGEMKKSSLKGASRQMVDSMTEKELREMASTRRKGKPKRVSKR